MLAEGDDRLDAAVRGGEGIFHGPRTALLGQASRKAGVIQVDPDDGLPLLLENGSGADAGSGTDDDVHTGPGGRLTTEVITRIGAPGPRPSDPGVSQGGFTGSVRRLDGETACMPPTEPTRHLGARSSRAKPLGRAR